MKIPSTFRAQIGCSRTSRVMSVLIVFIARQPMIIRENASMINATKTNPDQVAT